MKIGAILAGALLCVLTIHAADARPRHHRTRVHPRSIAGWAIVDPRGA